MSIAVFITGLAKGGFSGVGALAMPIAVMGAPPLQAAAILLPILIVQDAVSVYVFRRTWDRGVVFAMIPGMIVGVGLGWLYASALPAKALLGAVGAISMLFGLHRLWMERGGRIPVPSNSPLWVGSLFGAATGFTSQIAHAGAPPFQMWVLPRRLERDSLVGTSAISFAALNWIKAPAYAALGQLSPTNLRHAAVMLPLALISTFAGVWLVRRTDTNRFYTIIYVMMVLLGGKLLADALL